jgi:cytochrome c
MSRRSKKVSRSAVAFSLLLLGGLLPACGGDTPQIPQSADPERGRALIEQAGCGSCHRIPGIGSANGDVGPPLKDLHKRVYLAGILPNSFDILSAWIAQPQAFAPDSAMPNMGLSEEQARDIAAYLYTAD